MSKPKVNLSLCIGCGTCESMCSDCFKLAEDGHSHVQDNCQDDCCDLQSVVDACPVAAISLED